MIKKLVQSMFRLSGLIVLSGLIFCCYAPSASADTSQVAISLSPSTGTFVIDSTFDVPVYLDTKGLSINAIELSIKFQPDKLQLISSSTGKSVIGIWPSLPKFNNETGTVSLTGGVPGGLTASRGLITTLTFRVKSVGSTVVKIDSSRVLLNDGSGTEALVSNNGALYQLTLPPPAGPVVVSSTHPEQGTWYKSNTVELQWGDEGGVEGFSYMISDTATDVPDDISEGTQHSVSYRNVGDGRHYFHIKGLRNGQWGGTTHYAINIDTAPPADFKIEVIPGTRTARTRPVLQFATTDAASGIDHYELSIVALNDATQNTNQQFFIEAQSPYVMGELAQGKYDTIVRAYDLAGNVREVKQSIQIVPALFQNIGEDGLLFKSRFVLPWWVIWSILGVLVLIFIWLAWWFRRRHKRQHQALASGALTPEIERQLLELQEMQRRYGKAMVLILALALAFFVPHARAAESALSAPIITTVSENISNDEIFYAGGTTLDPKTNVILLLEDEHTGETFQQSLTSDENGQWFYRSESFLAPGNYIIWAQAKNGNLTSPPSPQVKITVEKKALQIGSAKLTYTTVYLLVIGLLLLLILILCGYMWYHHAKTKKKRMLHLRNLDEAQASIRHGFALLARDIQDELAFIHSTKQSKAFTEREAEREEMILRDLEQIQGYVGQEIWELGRYKEE